MVLILLLVPLLSAVVSLALKHRLVILEHIAMGAAFVELLLALAIGTGVSLGPTTVVSGFIGLDALGTIVILTIAIVGFAATVYSVGYLRQEVAKNVIDTQRVWQYFILLHLFLMAMFFAVATTNPILMWIGIEATTLTTVLLFRFYKKATTIEAAWKYLILNSIGLLLGFFGTLLFLTSVPTGSGEGHFATWQMLLVNASQFDPMVAKIAFVFVIVGYGTKAGLVPMHTWKPDAYSKTPTPIAALFSGPLLNVAILAIVRFKTIVDAAIGSAFSSSLLILFGVVSIGVASFIILVSKNYKRLLAYSSIEHAGVIALGFGFGGLGAFAAVLHMIYHALVKSVLFFSAGNLLLAYGSAKIRNVKNALSRVPVTSALLCIGCLAITGTPPFGLFLTEATIVSAGIITHPVATILVILFFAVIFIGFLKHVTAMVLSESDDATLVTRERSESAWLTWAPSIFLLGIFIALSIVLPGALRTLILQASANL